MLHAGPRQLLLHAGLGYLLGFFQCVHFLSMFVSATPFSDLFLEILHPPSADNTSPLSGLFYSLLHRHMKAPPIVQSIALV